MKIGLVDIDSHNYPNLPLMKISAYHKSVGDHVEFVTIGKYDKIYFSKIFDFTPEFTINSSFIECNDIIGGGTGYDIYKKLPNEIENISPDYSIYPVKIVRVGKKIKKYYNFSIQLFSRGCIRKCPFCVVNRKEGLIRSVIPMNLNPKGEFIEVLDNNFFANKEWHSAIDYLIDKKQPVNFHGVDIRIMNEEQAFWLNKLKHIKQIHIAWDLPDMDLTEKLTEVIKYIKPYKLMCYVLIGYDSTTEQDLFRVMRLRELGIDPFIMAFNKSDKYQKNFARWVNHKAIFKSVEWSKYKQKC
jgi:hypothetical protein